VSVREINTQDPRINLTLTNNRSYNLSSVVSRIASLYSEPETCSPKDSELLFGHNFKIYEIQNGFAYGQAAALNENSIYPGYVGFILESDLGAFTTQANYTVTALGAPVFDEANIKSSIKKTLTMGSHIYSSLSFKNFIKTESGDYIHREHIRKISDTPKVTDFTSIAEMHLGLPYIWGGISTVGLDCSGLVLSSLRAVGSDSPRDTDMMEEKLGTYLSTMQTDLFRGDLVFWKGHVGIMVSKSDIIHANAFHMSVTVEPLSVVSDRILEQGGGKITSIKRL
jgi:cell wall-associated NlpC family hydrolase